MPGNDLAVLYLAVRAQLNNLAGDFDQGYDQAQASTMSFRDKVKATLSEPSFWASVGANITLLTLPLDQALGKYESAIGQFKASTENAGLTVSQTNAELKTTSDSMANLGHNVTDTADALNVLQTGGIAPKDAVADLGTVADMAARQHKSLSGAAQDLVKILAGSGMIARQYGINLTDISDPASDLTKNEKALATAQDELTKAQEAATRAGISVTDQQDKTTTSTKNNSAAIATANREVQTATTSLANAQRKQAEDDALNQASMTTAHKNGASALAEDSKRSADAIASVQAAEDRLSTAQQKLAGLQGEGAIVSKTVASGHKETALQAYDASLAQEKLAAATKKVSDLEAAQKTLQDQVSAGTTKSANILDLLSQHLNGQASAAVDNFSGHIRVLWAHMYNDLVPVLQKAQPVINLMGPAFMGMAGAMEVIPAIGKGITGLFGKMIDIFVPTDEAVESIGQTAESTAPEVDSAMAEMAASIERLQAQGTEADATMAEFTGQMQADFGEAAAAAGPVEEEFGQLSLAGMEAGAGLGEAGEGAAAASPEFGALDIAAAPVILGILALASAGYLVYRNWGTIWPFVKEVFGDAAGFITQHLGMLTALFAPFLLPVEFLANHWHDLWTGIGDALYWVWAHVIKPVFDFFKAAVNDILGLIDKVTGAFHTVASIAMSPLSAVASVAHTLHIPGFAEGGMVGGPMGAATLAVVHGGERVLTPGQQASSGGGGTTIHLHVRGSILGNDVPRLVRAGLRDINAYSGDIGVGGTSR